MDSTFTLKDCDWQVILHEVDGESAGNVTVQRAGGQHFHATMISDSATRPNGTEFSFRQLLLIEHDQSHEKVGDVVIVLRQNPHTGRYMVQVEQENVFVTETSITKIWRAMRSSVDNIAQAVKKTVVHSGWVYTNPRRIGGKPLKTHYVIAGWSPQLAGSMLDVYDYVQTFDGPGLATFLKALQHMPDRPARAIFNQMRTPPTSGDED